MSLQSHPMHRPTHNTTKLTTPFQSTMPHQLGGPAGPPYVSLSSVSASSRAGLAKLEQASNRLQQDQPEEEKAPQQADQDVDMALDDDGLEQSQRLSDLAISDLLALCPDELATLEQSIEEDVKVVDRYLHERQKKLEEVKRSVTRCELVSC
jgi:hypothetical protein